MEGDDLTAWEHATLRHFIVVGQELAVMAYGLGAQYVTALLRLGEDGVVVFTVEDGRVWTAGDGLDVELTALPAHWHVSSRCA